MDDMLETALQYHHRGWAVIPIDTIQRKKPLVRWKRFQQERQRVGQIECWWNCWSNAGIAILLGPVSGIVAVDSDSCEAHDLFLERIGGPPETLTAISGSGKPGKRHYYFQCPEFPTGAKFTPWNKQLEFRGAGGYVVAPPSRHTSGNRYQYVDRDCPILELPDVLRAAWQQNPKARLAVPVAKSSPRKRMRIHALGDLEFLPGIAVSTVEFLEGYFAHSPGWNARLFNAACDLAGLGVSLEDAEPLLLRGADPDTASDYSQAQSTIKSAYDSPRVPLRRYAADLGRVIAATENVCFIHRSHRRKRFEVGE